MQDKFNSVFSGTSFIAGLTDIKIVISVTVPFLTIHSTWLATVIADALELI